MAVGLRRKHGPGEDCARGVQVNCHKEQHWKFRFDCFELAAAAFGLRLATKIGDGSGRKELAEKLEKYRRRARRTYERLHNTDDYVAFQNTDVPPCTQDRPDLPRADHGKKGSAGRTRTWPSAHHLETATSLGNNADGREARTAQGSAATPWSHPS